MNFIFKCLNKTSASIKTCLLISGLLLLISEWSNAAGLITKVSAKNDGDASVKLKGFSSPMQLNAGAWLPENAVPLLKDGAEISVLCLGSGAYLQVSKKEDYACTGKSKRVMRSSDQGGYPIVLIPSKEKLNKISHLVWTGAKNGDFELRIYKYIDGEKVKENPEKDWFPLKGNYHESGFFEYEFKTPVVLPLDEIDYYDIVIFSKKDSRSSNESDDLTSQIDSAEPANLLNQLASAIKKHPIKPESDLAQLAMAAQLLTKGYRSRAYELTHGIKEPSLEVLKQLIKVQALRIPGVPPGIMVAEYGRVLQLAISKNDAVNAAIACRGMADYVLILPDSGKPMLEAIKNTLGFSKFCPLVK